MTEWKKYEGTDEQIAEIHNSENGFIVRSHDGRESYINHINIHWTSKRIINYLSTATHYLICNPHPLKDMISRQAQTGQPVWIKITIDCEYAGLPIKDISVQVTTTPDWNIPGAEYSFTPFEDKK